MLEAGRCVITGLAMNAKDDLSDLLAAHPKIFNEYDKHQRQQSETSTELARPVGHLPTARSHQKRLLDLANIEAEIRKSGGFE